MHLTPEAGARRRPRTCRALPVSPSRMSRGEVCAPVRPRDGDSYPAWTAGRKWEAPSASDAESLASHPFGHILTPPGSSGLRMRRVRSARRLSGPARPKAFRSTRLATRRPLTVRNYRPPVSDFAQRKNRVPAKIPVDGFRNGRRAVGRVDGLWISCVDSCPDAIAPRAYGYPDGP